MSKKVLFIDRDGTLIEEPDDEQVDELAKVRFTPHVIPALLALRDSGFKFVMVSNQDGLGSDSFPAPGFEICQAFVLTLFKSQGIEFEEIMICPHLVEDSCACRKPRTGLLTKYLANNNLDTERSAVIGDRHTDIELAENLGLPGMLVFGSSGNDWRSVRDQLCSNNRHAEVSRSTRETSIRATVDLDRADAMQIDTGIGFYDHMLEQIAKHGGFSLGLSCNGDLDVDDHHTIEDTAICLGQAIKDALGDKRGIGRYGFLLPMDESTARVALDLSGRSSFHFAGTFPREQVGGLATEMVPHFFQSLSEAMGAALHIDVSGENAHHMVEACFKSVGRCLRQAIQQNGQDLPSTKGVLG